MVALAEFHYYPNLPRELQVMIWEAAMRDDVPGLHAFFFEPHCLRARQQTISNPITAGVIFGHNDEKSRETWRKRSSYGQVKAIIQSPGYSTDADGLTGRFGDFPWRRPENTSLYLHDGGLWTACKLSRWVMISHHKMLSRQADTQTVAIDAPDPSQSPTAEVKKPKYRDIAVAGHFPLETGERLPFHISSTDIVLIQAEWVSELAQNRRQLETHTDQFSKAICQALENVNHLAVEWDRWMFLALKKWGPDGILRNAEGTEVSFIWPTTAHERRGARGLLPRLLRLACQGAGNIGNGTSVSKPRHFWFIDLSLKRDPDWHPEPLTVEEQNNPTRRRHVFHGTGMRFIEVRSTDKGWKAPCLEAAHRCDFRWLCRSPEGGAHCGIRVMVDRIHRNLSNPGTINKDELVELFECGPVGVLAVECGDNWDKEAFTVV